MELSISLEYLEKQRGNEGKRDFRETAALCKNAGYHLVDFSSNYKSEDYARIAQNQREILQKNGISVEQTHAPMNRYCQHEPELFWVYYQRLFEISKILGAKYVVVHADEYRTRDSYNEKEILEYTYNYLAPFVEYAAKNNMVVAVENVFEDNSKRWPQINGKSRFTSRVEELLSVIERFNTKSVQCCWDFGHARCAYGNEQLSALKQVGKYVCCTHVHDNYYNTDLHLMPYLGDTDWESHMKYLKEIGYKGNFSMEFVYGKLPDALLPQFLRLTHEVGEYLLNLEK